jgi:hypothetical protein
VSFLTRNAKKFHFQHIELPELELFCILDDKVTVTFDTVSGDDTVLPFMTSNLEEGIY